MNKELNKLFEIAHKPECRIIGIMSGTSLDGLDIAVCKVSKKMITQEEFKCIQYPNEILEGLKRTRSKELVSLAEISLLNTKMAIFYANEINSALNKWGIDNDEIDLISSHGQTIYHNSEIIPKNTFQIVDGDHIAQKTGIITISDFRQKHISVGGEGAPLAVYLDNFLFQDEKRIRVALNLGGIANLTFIPPKNSHQQALSTDIGPANTLINDAMQHYFNKEFDNEGKTASKGKTHVNMLTYLLLDPFFKKPFPKSTGQELFNLQWVHGVMEKYSIQMSSKNLVSTLTELSNRAISLALDEVVGDENFDLIVSGGGCYNKTLMKRLKNSLSNVTFIPIDDFGISSDAKEAVLMAFLAFIQLQKHGVTVDSEFVHLGKICLPN